MTLLYFAARSTALLLLIRFLHGVSFGVTTTATGTIVARLVPRERYGEGIGYYSLSQTMATAIGPFIGILLSQRGSFDSIIVACSIASAIGLVILPLLSVNEVELTGEQADEAKGFRLSNFIEPKVVPIALVSMTTYICYSTVVSFLSVYSQAIHLVTAASFFFIVYAAAVFITRPLVGRRFDAKGENSVMYPAIPVFAIGMAVFSQAHSAYVLLVAGALIGCGLGAIQSSGQAISVKITRLHRMGLAISTFFMFSDIGMGTGPLLAGLVVPFIGYRGMYTVVAIVAAGCLFLYYALYGRRPLVAA
jgi:predicted MFS family arabinose efflux permease